MGNGNLNYTSTRWKSLSLLDKNSGDSLKYAKIALANYRAMLRRPCKLSHRSGIVNTVAITAFLGPRYAAALERRNSYGVHWHCHSKESELGWSG